MNRFRNFFNKKANNSKIFSREEIKNMTSDEFRANEKAIDYQMAQVGVPFQNELPEKKGFFGKGVPTGAASAQQGMTPGEVAQSVVYEDLMRPAFPLAADSIRNGMHDLSEAKKDRNAVVNDNLNGIADRKLYDFMKDVVKIPPQSKGVMYNPYSKYSKKIGDSPEIKDFVNKNYDDLKNGKIESAQINFQFPFKNRKNISDPLNSTDRWGSMGHVTLYNPKIDANDNFSTRAVDYYNFDRNEKVNVPNEWAYGLQNKGIMKNYYTVTDIYKKINKK